MILLVTVKITIDFKILKINRDSKCPEISPKTKNSPKADEKVGDIPLGGKRLGYPAFYPLRGYLQLFRLLLGWFL